MGEVAIYDLGEKVIRLIKVPILMFAQAAFPQFSKEKNISKLNQFFLVGVGIALLLYGLVFEFSDSIVELVGGVRWAVSASTRYFSRSLSIRLSVLVPIDPVEPRMLMRLGSDISSSYNFV